MGTSTNKFLNRFTTLPFLMDMLQRKYLTLLNPDSWDDKNDTVTLKRYLKEKNKKSIYVLCLTDKRETIHHWNAFANDTSGCCIEFDSQKLLNTITNNDSVVKHGKVEYIRLNKLSPVKNSIEKLPFFKRDPFQAENEYRIIVVCDEEQKLTLDIPIELDVIKKITISKKLPDSVFESVKQVLETIDSTLKGKINHSTLFDNPKWRNHFENNNNQK